MSIKINIEYDPQKKAITTIKAPPSINPLSAAKIFLQACAIAMGTLKVGEDKAGKPKVEIPNKKIVVPK